MDREDTSLADRLVRDARERAAGEESGRLPLPGVVTWATFPFEGDLRVKPVDDPVLPEPPRGGAGGIDCRACDRPDGEYVWTDADWRLTALREPTGLPLVVMLEPRAHHDLGDLPAHLAAALGPMVQRVERALMSLGGVGIVHVCRWGDGSEHLHLWFLPRPEGLIQARGTCLALWDDVLPPRPVDEWQASIARVRAAMERGT